MTTPTEQERLAAADAAFERGDFAAVRREATLLARSRDADVSGQARRMLEKVGVDPAAIGVWLASLVMFLAICFRYLGEP